jgi:hypothetical protein
VRNRVCLEQRHQQLRLDVVRRLLAARQRERDL